MIAPILYIFAALPFIKMSRMYYKSHNGFERIGMIWLNGVLAFGLFSRGVSYLLFYNSHDAVSDIIGVVSVGAIVIVAWVHCIFLMKKYDNWRFW